MGAIEAVRTAPIEMEGRVQSFKVRKPLIPPGPGWAARVDPDRVMVEVIIGEQSASRRIEGIPLRVLVGAEGPAAFRLDPGTVDVIVQGRAEVLTLLEKDAFRAFVDLPEGDEPGRYELPIRVYTSVPVRIVSATPATAVFEMKEPP